MKIFKSLIVVLAFGFMLSTTSNLYGVPDKGSHEESMESALCTSGVAYICTGDGNVCDITIGWDCKPLSQE